ncbi:MAG: gliding motility-associated C-terminal domain-containing protein [Bacteroidetes bacterium]|nr:gliding motility-associated C-terminal domain-containing protein [Bacteroidota bacterium]
MLAILFKLKKAGTGFVLLLVIFSLNSLYAQEKTACDYSLPGQVLNWNFGEKAQLTFSEEETFPVSTSMPGGIDIPKGVSAISDADGNLLFFSDGMKVSGSGYFELTNGTALMGNLLANQSALFIPSPGNPNRYFLITADLYIPPVYTNGVRYSVIEKVGYSWEVTEKNILLLEQNAQKLAAVQHQNGEDFWLVTHGFGATKGGSYFSFRVMNDSISVEPVESTVGAIHDGDFNNNGGYMKISPDGSKIALAIPDAGIVELAAFNTATGQVSNPITSNAGQFNYPLSLEFSPDSKLLYLTTNPLDNSNNYLYQFNLALTDINNPEEIHAYTFNDGRQMGALQLAVDGRIYLGSFGQALSAYDHLGVIYNPKRAGTACNYNTLDGNTTEGLALNASGSKEGLPNFISSYFDIPHFWWENHCHRQPTIFRLQNEVNHDQVLWEFGDAGATANSSRGQHIFSEPGLYTVSVTETENGQSFQHERELEIYPLPPVEIGNYADTIFILPNSSITLDAGVYDEYIWMFEDEIVGNERTLDVEEKGLYAVTVTDTNCCVNTDEVVIWFANIYLPNAFRPKSNIARNQTFKPLGAVSALNNFQLLIYNRWGQLVFESNSPDDGWDGTINGAAAPVAAYVWLMRYESLESSFQAAQEVVQRGVVNLVR